MQRSLFKSLLRVKLPTREVGLLFKHRRFDKPTVDLMTCKRPLNGITYCEIYKILPVNDVTIIVCGRGFCKWPDRYDKKLGRKRSLTSAMNKRNVMSGDRIFTKEERELIWAAYWERIHPIVEAKPFGPIPLEAGSLATQDGTIIGAE